MPQVEESGVFTRSSSEGQGSLARVQWRVEGVHSVCVARARAVERHQHEQRVGEEEVAQVRLDGHVCAAHAAADMPRSVCLSDRCLCALGGEAGRHTQQLLRGRRSARRA